jgi:hypothetical protein
MSENGSGPERCVIVVDESLPAGLAANAAAVLAVTLGADCPALAGEDFADASGRVHRGLIPMGLPVLRASATDLASLRTRADDDGVSVIAMPTFGQQTNDYDEFRSRVAETTAEELRYLGVALYGEKRAVRSLTGSFALLR